MMFLEIFAALCHFDEHDRLPDVMAEGRSTAVFGRTLQTESLKKSVEENLRLTFFVAGDAAIKPIDERAKLFGVRHDESFTRAVRATRAAKSYWM